MPPDSAYHSGMATPAERASAIRSAADPRVVSRVVGRAHELFVTGVGAGAGGVRSVVLDSWHRSTRHGVDPSLTEPPLDLTEAGLREARRTSPLAHVMPLIRDLLTYAAADGGHVVAVGDPTGHLLWVEGSRPLRTQVEAMGFVEGALWSEAAVGTNAPGTALALNSPVQIVGAEHFVAAVHSWSCTAVPVHDPRDGSVLGVLDVTGNESVASAQALALVRATVAAAEATLRALPSDLSDGPPPGPTAPPGQAGSGTWLLEVLGRDAGDLVRNGHRIRLSPRHTEILLLLVRHPQGLTAERLALLLHEHDVPTVTIRAELARLRRTLGGAALASRPYRLTVPMVTDVDQVADALDSGSLRAALTRYRGPILPTSASPAVAELRLDLGARLRRAALGSSDAADLLAFAATVEGREDPLVLRAALDRLPADSPRRFGIEARLAVLDHLYG